MSLRKISLKKKILVVTLILISIPALLTAINVFHKMQNTAAAKAKVYSARQTAEKTADEKVNKALDILKQSGATTTSIGSSKVDVCYLSPSYSGFSTSNWYQKCYLRYAEGFTTSLGEGEVKQKLRSVPVNSIVSNFSQEITTDCGLYIKYNDDNYSKTTILSYLPALSSGKDGCKVPNILRGTRSIDIPILTGKELSIKAYRTFDKKALDNSQNQIWLTLDEPYYNEDLGCAIKILDCISPRSKPVHPEI